MNSKISAIRRFAHERQEYLLVAETGYKAQILEVHCEEPSRFKLSSPGRHS